MPQQPIVSKVILSDVLSKEELRAYSRPSNVKAGLILAGNWLLIIAIFAMVVVWPNPITVLLGVLLLAGRQLSLSVLMHDCSHHAFFTTKRLNEFFGRWFTGGPINICVRAYRDYHVSHHQHAGTPGDPDRIFTEKYPVSRASLKRKFIRDFTGQTGFRDTIVKLKNGGWSQTFPWAVFHIALITILTMAGAPWAYLMWWAGELLIYPALMRLRQIGEHGIAQDRNSRDARDNTGTTLASWWERLLVAPNNVNFHAEHHLFAAVPSYNLPDLHRTLHSRGYYKGFESVTDSYSAVLKKAIREKSAQDEALTPQNA